MDSLHIFLLFLSLFSLYKLHGKVTNGVCKSKRRLEGMTCLVTGGTSGLGLEIALDFAARGARVIIACPFLGEGNKARQKVVDVTKNRDVLFKFLDLSSLKSVRQFAADILESEDRLDILMNNAAVGVPRKITNDRMNIIMQVNYFGHFLLTLLLLPLLKKTGTSTDPSRIVNTSSISHLLGSFDKNTMHVDKTSLIGRLFTYGDSKLCLLMFSHELSKKLLNTNVVINDADPGEVATNIYFSSGSIIGYFFYYTCMWMSKNPWEGAQTPVYVAVDEKVGRVCGKLFRNCRIFSSWKKFSDITSKELWCESLKAVQLSDEALTNCFS